MPVAADDLVHLRLRQVVDTAPDFPWVAFADGSSYTTGELQALAERFAAGLQTRGISKGDRIAMLIGNRVEFLVCWFAAHMIGALPVPMNTALRGLILTHQCALVESKLIVSEDTWLERLAEAIGAPAYLETVVVIPSTGDGPLPYEWRGWTRFERFDEIYEDRALNPVDLRPWDPASIMFTSATTGPSKGIVWSHTSTLHLMETWARHMALGPEDTVYASLPLFHTNALATGVIPSLLAGARAFIAPRFSVSQFWVEMQRSRATITNLLGAMVPLLLRREPSAAEREHAVRAMWVCPAGRGVPATFKDRFGVEIVSGYGMTDLGIVVYSQSGEPFKDARAGASCGKVLPEWELRIVDEHDYEVSPGEAGRALVRPRRPWIMPLGYWRSPEATVQATRNMWFHTGDIVRQDTDGWLCFIDRMKDMIRRRGENVSALEVEAAVLEHPAVQECAAYALPSELDEDEVAIAVVLENGELLTEDALLQAIEARLPYFALPRYVTLLSKLPKTQTEKVQKARLRELGVTSATWDREAAGYEVTR